MFESVVGGVDVDHTIIDPSSKEVPKAPGMKYRHYAPKGDLTIVEGEREKVVNYINEKTAQARSRGEKTGVICTDETKDRYNADAVKSVGTRKDEETVAHELFHVLREFDDENVTVMYSESFDSEGIGMAIMNRLKKAAGQQIVRL
jgi:L-threonylcarbamoyladenylate synthase